MSVREQVIQQLDQLPDDVQTEVLCFINSLQTRDIETSEESADAYNQKLQQFLLAREKAYHDDPSSARPVEEVVEDLRKRLGYSTD